MNIVPVLSGPPRPAAILEIPHLSLTRYADTAHDIVRHRQQLFYTNRKELKLIEGTHARDSGPQTVAQGTEIWDLQATDSDLIYGSSTNFGIVTGPAQHASIPLSPHVIYLHPSWNDTGLIYSE